MASIAKGPASSRDSEPRDADLEKKIGHILEELRVVLPGTQALLGFQFIAVFSNTFDALSEAAKALHLLSLISVCLSTMLLMTPAAYNRIVYDGGESEEFHKMASGILLSAMALLSFGVATELLVVFSWTTGDSLFAILVALATFLTFTVSWFAYPAFKRSRA